MGDEPRPVASDPEGSDPIVSRVRALLDLAARHRLAELQISAGDFRLKVRSGENTSQGQMRFTLADAAATEATTPAADDEQDGHLITAPMIGTFYVAPAPGEPPFVSVGDTVEQGQTIAIIEAMKIMNEIQSDRAGVVDEVLARNGQGVEFDQPLFRLRPL